MLQSLSEYPVRASGQLSPCLAARTACRWARRHATCRSLFGGEAAPLASRAASDLQASLLLNSPNAVPVDSPVAVKQTAPFRLRCASVRPCASKWAV